MNIFDLQATISLNSSGFMSGIQEAQGAFSGLGSTVSGTGKGITAGTIAWGTAIGNFATKAAGAMMDFGREIADTGMAFDSSMSNVAAISGATGETLDALRDKAKEMGATTKFTATEAADAFSYMAMAGWDASQMMDGISGIMNLAAASGEDLATTSDIVTDALTAFGLKAEDSGHFADVLAAASSAANTNVSMMGETFKYVAPLAGTMGYSVEDMATAIGTMANSGIKGSQAGTALRSAITRLVKPTKEVYMALNQLGLEGGAITNADGSMMSFSETVAVLRDAFSGLDEADQAMYAGMIFGQEAMSGMLAIINSSEAEYNALADTIGAASEAMDGAGTAAQMAATQLDSLPGQVTLMQSAFDGLKTSIYEGLKGPLQDAAEIATDVFSGLTDAINEGGIIGAFENLGSILAGNIGPKLEELGPKFRNMLSAISPDVADTLPAIASGFEQFFEAVKSVGGAAIEPLAAGTQDLLSAFSTVAGDAIEIASRGISQFIDALRDSGAVSGIIGTIAEGAGRLISAFSGAAVDVMDGVSAAVGSFMDAFDNGVLSDIISKVADGAKNLIAGIMQGRADVIAGIGGGIKNFLDAFAESGVAETIADIATNAAAFFKTIASVTGDLISGVASGIKTFIAGFDNSSAVGIIDDFVSVIGDLFAMFSEGFAGIITSIADAFSGFGDKIAELWNTAGPSLAETGEAFHAFADNVRDSIDRFMAVCQPVAEWIASVLAVGIQMAVENIIRTFGNLWNAAMNVVAFLQETFGAFVDLMHGDVQGAVEGFKAAWENIKEFFGNLGEMLLAPFKTLASVLGDEANKGVAAIKAPFEAAWEWFINVGTNIVEGIKSGLANAWSGLTSWIDDKVSGLVGGVMGLLGIHSPSTVFAGIGRNMVLGMREGWADTFGGLESYIGRDVQRLTDTARIGFEDSAIGRSSAAGISSMFAANEGGGRGDPVSINLILDGDVAATALYDPLQRTAFQKGHGSTGGVLQPA